MLIFKVFYGLIKKSLNSGFFLNPVLGLLILKKLYFKIILWH